MEHEMLLTMAVAIGLGPLLVVAARRLALPAIVLLLLGGVLLGPEFLGIVRPNSLGDGLRVIVELAVGVILFEGGLTLELRGRRTVSTVIDRLLTIGVLTTWLLTALAIRFIFGFTTGYSLLSASLVIVTGPTVIGPMLKRLRLTERLHNILHWEGVLIDPIGVFVALLCFEWVSGYGGQMALSNFALRFAVGLAIGIIGGLAIYQLIRLRVAPEDMINEMTLASAVILFGISEMVVSMAGLLTVAVAGFVLGLMRPLELRRIRQFKAEITDLLIGLLFILLSARLQPQQFQEFGARGIWLIVIVMLLVRPLNILFSTTGQKMSWRERVFLSWMAPRGIVAASMASLFAITLEASGQVTDPRFVETFTYSVIIATVILQGLTAEPLAVLLKVRRPKPVGWAIVGAHTFGRRLARFLSQTAQLPTLLLDTNPKAVAEARAEGLSALECDATDPAIPIRADVQAIGNLLALTDNQELNIVLCAQWAPTLGKEHLYRWSPEGSTSQSNGEAAGRVVWTSLPKPSLLSAELARGEAWMPQSPEPLSSLETQGVALLSLAGKIIMVDPEARQTSSEKTRAILYVVREANYLLRCVDERFALRLDVSDTRGLFEALIGRVAQESPDLPAQELIDDLVERESTFPTVLGHGVAVPHIFHRNIRKRYCVVALVPRGLDFHAPDEHPVSLVFLLLSPLKDADGHLATLGEISRLVGDAEVRNRLLGAEQPADLVRIIRDVQTARGQ